MNKFTALALLAGLITSSCAGGNGGSSTLPTGGSSLPGGFTPQSSSAQAGAPSSDAATDITDFQLPQTGSFPGTSGGYAFAALVSVKTKLSTKILAGPIAPATLGCGSNKTSDTNSVATLSVPGVTSTGTAADAVMTTHSDTSAGATSTSTVEGLSALGGLITATAVKAEANSSATAGNASSNENGSQFTGLVVAGLPITVNPAPDTNITLPGIGYVVLNEVIGPVNGASTTRITVNMIHIHVTTANLLKLAVGTNIIVASATSSFVGTSAPFTNSADAYSLLAHGVAGNINLVSGPFAIARVCNDGSNENRLADVTTPVGVLGTLDNIASATNSSATSTAQAKSSTGSANLLGGLITAQAIVTIASTDRSGTTFTRSGSLSFTHLVIAGVPINANVAPNTRIDLANLGYVIVNQQTGSTTGTSATEQVSGLHIFVTTSNSFNLPIGAQIIVAHAAALTRAD